MTRLLTQLGLELDFQMEAQAASEYCGLSPFPAQYHFRGPGGLSVIYLEGRDANLDGVRYPPHESRWWLYVCEDSPLVRAASSLLSLTWSLTWVRLSSSAEDAVA